MTIPHDTLILLAGCYEQYMYAEDPTTPTARRAKLVFDNECRRLYDVALPSLRTQMSFEKYVAAVVIPDVLRQLESPPPPACV
jgi:hypothetical protein